jgi:membrane protein required for colicin V production
MDFNTFDAIILSITIILAIKGFFNGIIKEISGLIGIVLGVYLGSTYYKEAGEYINSSIFKIPNESAINVVGFVAVFVLSWLIIVVIGMMLAKIVKIAQLGILDRIGGVIFSAGKFFVIVAVIVTMLSKIEAMHQQIEKWSKNSLTYPYLLETGNFLIKIKPEDVKEKVNSVKDNLNDITEKISNKVSKDVAKKIEETKEEISNTIAKSIEKNLTSKGE